MLYLKRKQGSATTADTPAWPARFRQLAAEAKHPALRAFYAAGAVAGDTPVSQVPFTALDLETTGLDAEKHSIVSIGVVPFTLARIRCGEARYWVVKPRRPLNGESVTIHHITHDEIAHAPDIIEVFGDLLATLSGRVMVVHYRVMERRFLASAMHERLNERLEFPVVDTMELEARIHRRRFRGLLPRLLGRGPASLRLAECRSRYNLPMYSAHHALTDALATAELLQAQIAHRFDPDTPIRELWL